MKKLQKFYILTAASYDFIFAYAVYNAYFELQGLSVKHISYLLAFWAFSAMIFEIPSGALADRFNHRTTIILAPLLKMFTFIIWAVADGNIIYYGLGFMIWALASTLRSGTMEAYLYEGVKYHNQISEYEKILGKVKFYKQIAIAISMISGGIIAYYNIHWVFTLSIIPLLMSSYFAIQLQNFPNIANEYVSYLTHIRNAKQAFYHNRKLQMLLFYSLMISLFGDLEEFDQLYFQFLKLPIWSFGMIAFIISILSSYFMSKAYVLKNFKNIYLSLVTLSLIALMGVVLSNGLLSVFFLALSYIIIAPMFVLIDGQIQNAIEDQSRATVTSLNGLFINMFGVIITPIFGFLSGLYTIKSIYMLMAILVSILMIFTLKNKKNFQ